MYNYLQLSYSQTMLFHIHNVIRIKTRTIQRQKTIETKIYYLNSDLMKTFYLN